MAQKAESTTFSLLLSLPFSLAVSLVVEPEGPPTLFLQFDRVVAVNKSGEIAYLGPVRTRPNSEYTWMANRGIGRKSEQLRRRGERDSL